MEESGDFFFNCLLLIGRGSKKPFSCVSAFQQRLAGLASCLFSPMPAHAGAFSLPDSSLSSTSARAYARTDVLSSRMYACKYTVGQELPLLVVHALDQVVLLARVCLFLCPFVCLSVCFSVRPSVRLGVKMLISLSAMMTTRN